VKPAVTDPFPTEIQIIRGRRRSIELSLADGKLQARVPKRMRRREIESILPELRHKLWIRLQRERVFDQAGLQAQATHVRRTLLSDLPLPPHEVGFSKRQRRRWGSCVWDGRRGRIWISDRLRGHPIWVIDVLLLHELIHLLVPDHGARFQELMRRSPDHERGRGYLEALETVDQIGPTIQVALTDLETPDVPQDGERSVLPLFAPLSSAAAERGVL